MKRLLFLFVLLLLGCVSAGSSTESHIIVPGCSFNLEGETITVSAGSCSSGDAYGLFYCDDDFNAYVTTQDMRGCSRGGEDFDDPCCPIGMYCNKTSYLCEPRIDNCYILNNEADCKDVGCFWLDTQCVDTKSDFGCDYYQDETSCKEDFWNLGSEGVGTDYCGGSVECAGNVFYVPSDGCTCEWYPLLGCQVKLVANERFTEGGGGDSFSCTNDYELGNCSDGVQSVKWDSNATVVSGFEATGGVVPQECLELLGCASGAGQRFCGEDLVKLPFFSWFSLLISLGLIFLFYFFQRDVRKV